MTPQPVDKTPIEILWRGPDPAKFTALQAALRDENIQFWHAQVYDPVGGLLPARPFYLEASPGFEIRVHTDDFERAKKVLAWVESEANASRAPAEASKPGKADKEQLLPDHWNPREATSEAWSGEDKATAEYLASALRENGIPSRISSQPGARVNLFVRPADVERARKIAGEVSGEAPAK